MSSIELIIELLLVLLLGATLAHALRLERALRTLRQDRSAMEDLLSNFHDSTRLAEDGAERFRLAAEVAGKQITRQVERASALKDDLSFLIDRADKAADTLDRCLAKQRSVGSPTLKVERGQKPEDQSDADVSPARSRSQAERDLIKALRLDGAR